VTNNDPTARHKQITIQSTYYRNLIVAASNLIINNSA